MLVWEREDISGWKIYHAFRAVRTGVVASECVYRFRGVQLLITYAAEAFCDYIDTHNELRPDLHSGPRSRVSSVLWTRQHIQVVGWVTCVR